MQQAMLLLLSCAIIALFPEHRHTCCLISDETSLLPPAAPMAPSAAGASTFVRTLWAEPADAEGDDDEDSSDAEAEAALMHKYGIS